MAFVSDLWSDCFTGNFFKGGKKIMTLKKLSITLAAAVLMNVFFISSAMAGDPKWREKQKAWFEEIGVVPGDVITKDNCQKIKGVVPDKIFAWIEKVWW